MSVVAMKNLLESGVHFGHQTRRWDPKMSKYIFAERNGIHIIDLQKTMIEIDKAYEAVRKVVLDGKKVLFVGTKKQASAVVEKEAERCNQYYINNRWLGGMLTNFSTIKKSIARLKKIEKMEVDGSFDSRTKKEKLLLLKEKEKLDKNLGGIKDMTGTPGIVFVIDSKNESIAVSEAKKLNIPIVGVVDTNCNPDLIDFPIPGNDDAIRAIGLFCKVIADACIDAENELGIAAIDMVSKEMEEAKKNENTSETDEKKEVKKQKENTEEKSEVVMKNEESNDEESNDEDRLEEKKQVENQQNKTEKNKVEEKGNKDMKISAKDVKKLKDMTNVGLSDCKDALVKANGDFDGAVKFLKEKGLADAKKRSDRETKEGGVFIKKEGNKIATILLGCETDFVSNNDIFKNTASEILDKVLESDNSDISAYKELIDNAISQIKENVELKEIIIKEIAENEVVDSYIHGNNKIGVISVFGLEDASVSDNDLFKEMTKNISLHIAAAAPFYLSESDVPEDEISEQKDIYLKQLEGSDKPDNIKENIIKGKLGKHFGEICLLSQPYVKDDKLTVAKYIESVSKELGKKVILKDFVRLMIGK